MIIHNIRLKNIRSYGEGPDGNGLTVTLEPGINRIAGINGAGKSTLIEAVGLALFGAEPEHEENFRTETYFLRTGEKSGEIDITFSQGGETYRLERGLGKQNKRKTKVVRIHDGFAEAEGDEEVYTVLSRLFNVESRARLEELFTKLIGIKQGRLILPFDSKPTDAGKYFEPLLDVEVFRRCHRDLLPVVSNLKAMVHGLENQQHALAERIRDRATSASEHEQADQRCRELEHQAAAALEQQKTARERCQALQTQERQIKEAERAAQAAKAAAAVAAEKARHAEENQQKARASLLIVKENQAAHDVFLAAEQALQGLQAKMQQKGALEKQRAEAEKQVAGCQEKVQAARAQAEKLAEQKRLKETEQARRIGQLAEDRKKFGAGEPAFAARLAAAEQIQKAQQTVKAWAASLAQNFLHAQRQQTGIEQAGRQLAAWQPELLAQAETKCRQARDARDQLHQSCLAAQSQAATLGEQLKQISGGVCPFLKEHCRQFDPAKVSSDLASLHREAARLEKEFKARESEYKESEQRLNDLKAKAQTIQATRENLQRLLSALVDYAAIVPGQEVVAAGRCLRSHLGAEPPPGLLEPASPSALNELLPPEGPPDLDKAEAILKGISNAADLAKTWIASLEPAVKAWQEEIIKARDARVAENKRLEIEEKSLGALGEEIARSAHELTALTRGQEEAARQMESGRAEIQKLTETLRAYEKLDQQLQEAQDQKSRQEAGHHRYLAAKPLADELAQREQIARQARQDFAQLEKQCQALESALQQVRAGYNERELETAQEALRVAGIQSAVAEASLKRAREDLGKAAQRLAEWQAAVCEWDVLLASLRRHHAAIQITEKARVILRDTASLVARNLCQQIAAHAQELFNLLNHEPAQLAWEAESFSLRINPGVKEKRFAMLSGGEQTKLALAMTLAMIRRLIGCKFCIFDEPTYGADAESRHKIADAVVAAQAGSKFDQLLLVSHDEAFDGKIEHVVTLRKTGPSGTEIAE